MKTAPGRRPNAEKTAADEHADEHPIALKVMRLSKPNLRPPPPAFGKSLAVHPYSRLPVYLGQNCVPSMLILPESGTEVYIGQVFASYICVSNK